ncbi:MAG: S-layer homology domain-containing protein, partial [Lachnospiraceae bacterium]|nr:S-layer homology domain-containing protein [Lachnospiraceae bacterium]
FSPADSTTRGQFATMLYRFAGSPAFEMPANPFTDVSKSDGYFKPIMWAYATKIVNGTSKTTYSPKDTCTRGQIVTMLYKMAGKPDISPDTVNPFKDVRETDGYYKAIMWAVEKGLTKGTSKTTFSPKDPCKRSQIVTFLYRYFFMD